jgi:hypothetical protein
MQRLLAGHQQKPKYRQRCVKVFRVFKIGFKSVLRQQGAGASENAVSSIKEKKNTNKNNSKAACSGPEGSDAYLRKCFRHASAH